MTATAHDELVRTLKEAHALEKQAIQLLEKGAKIAGDDEIGAIYRAHLLQTNEHERYVAERLQAHGESPSKTMDAATQAAALGLGAITQVAPDTPTRLATAAFAFENLEIAAYRLLARLADHAGDSETKATAERILEQEEAAAELVAGTLDRAVEHLLGEPATSPVPPVTPIGKPSDRPSEDLPTPHGGPEALKDRDPDQPAGTPPNVPGEGRRAETPEPGHPAGDVRPRPRSAYLN